MIIFLLILFYVLIVPYLEKFQRTKDFQHKKKLVDRYIRPFVDKEDLILDVGSGSGSISKLLNAEPLDVVDLHEVGAPPGLFDGESVPYADDTFDAVLCISVLHHTENQKKLLEELKRVSKNKIIIFEDVPDSIVDKILCRIHSFSAYGRCSKCFHTTNEWRRIFHEHGLRVEHIVNVPRSYSLLYPVKRKMFILNK